MSKAPEIPSDRPSSWIVDEDDNWVETEFIVVNPGCNRPGRCDDFNTDLIPPFKEGLPLGGTWSGAGDADDFTVTNNEFHAWEEEGS